MLVHIHRRLSLPGLPTIRAGTPAAVVRGGQAVNDEPAPIRAAPHLDIIAENFRARANHHAFADFVDARRSPPFSSVPPVVTDCGDRVTSSSHRRLPAPQYRGMVEHNPAANFRRREYPPENETENLICRR